MNTSTPPSTGPAADPPAPGSAGDLLQQAAVHFGQIAALDDVAVRLAAYWAQLPGLAASHRRLAVQADREQSPSSAERHRGAANELDVVYAALGGLVGDLPEHLHPDPPEQVPVAPLLALAAQWEELAATAPGTTGASVGQSCARMLREAVGQGGESR